MRLRFFYGALSFAMLCCLPSARAQSAFDLGIGFGTFHDASNKQGIDNSQSINAFGTCVVNSGDPFCQKTASLGGFFLGFAGDYLITKRYGFGAEVTFQPNRPNYGPLQYRQTFYDFNGILTPINETKVQLQLQGGIGGSHTSFSVNESQCLGVAICTNNVLPFASVNHFQLHVGVGVHVFVTEHIFVRPQFDFHYVPGLGGNPTLTNPHQFDSSAVPGFMVFVGYGWH